MRGGSGLFIIFPWNISLFHFNVSVSFFFLFARRKLHEFFLLFFPLRRCRCLKVWFLLSCTRWFVPAATGIWCTESVNTGGISSNLLPGRSVFGWTTGQSVCCFPLLRKQMIVISSDWCCMIEATKTFRLIFQRSHKNFSPGSSLGFQPVSGDR